jgi:hypothetical protein
MRIMTGEPDMLFTLLVIVFLEPPVAIAVLILGAIVSDIGKYPDSFNIY